MPPIEPAIKISGYILTVHLHDLCIITILMCSPLWLTTDCCVFFFPVYFYLCTARRSITLEQEEYFSFSRVSTSPRRAVGHVAFFMLNINN